MSSAFEWTFPKIIWSIIIFCAAGVAEILGGWLVWSSIRGTVEPVGGGGEEEEGKVNKEGTVGTAEGEGDQINAQKKPFWYAIIGSFILILYGFIPCLQPTDSFGRIYAVYGGFFIVLSFLFGWYLDGDQPDLGDVVGGIVALIGVLLIMLWPRNNYE
jgi:small multidrug resistance family-3 protein